MTVYDLPCLGSSPLLFFFFFFVAYATETGVIFSLQSSPAGLAFVQNTVTKEKKPSDGNGHTHIHTNTQKETSSLVVQNPSPWKNVESCVLCRNS